jgi:hypothetical protein
VDDLVDEGYGGEEHDHAVPSSAAAGIKVAELERALVDNDGRLPPQTIVMSVLREIEDDYKHYLRWVPRANGESTLTYTSSHNLLSIYTDLADQYKRMSPLSAKRNVLAEHLKEVIDTMELKVSRSCWEGRHNPRAQQLIENFAGEPSRTSHRSPSSQRQCLPGTGPCRCKGKQGEDERARDCSCREKGLGT